MHRIQLEQVLVRYPNPDGGEKLVLNNITLRVQPGEFITVVGPSGCGKSTTLRLILGAEQPTSGQTLLDQRRIEEPGRDRGIVFQKYSLFEFLKVWENVALGLNLEAFSIPGRLASHLIYRRLRQQHRDRAMEYLESVGLTAEAGKYPHQLSGGMRQRVAIAQTLVMEPKVLLMDEPYGALDDQTRESLQRFILRQWIKTQTTIFFVTHNVEEAVFLGTRIICLSPYYRTDTSNDPNVHGSKVVLDKALPAADPENRGLKYTPEFATTIAQVRRDLDPKVLQHTAEFDLSHPDALKETA